MPASPAVGLFVLLGVSLLAGFLGHLLFKRHRVSDVLLLLGVGAVLGPLFHVIDASILSRALPFLAPLGLALVLFEGGLELSFHDLRAHAARGVAMALLTWTGTAAAVALVAHLLVGLAWPLAAMLGAAVAATGIFVVIPLLAQIRAPPSAKVALTIETALGDLLSAVVVTAIAGVLVLGATPLQGATALVTKLAIGAAFGVLVGVLWGRALHLLTNEEHGFPLTLAALILTYAATEWLGGSGYVGALAFGLFLGNARSLTRLGIPALAAPPAGVRLHQREAVFILRSLYFVYVGLAMSPAVFTGAGLALLVAFTWAMLAVRVVTVSITNPPTTPDARAKWLLLVGMMPRGLAAVIVASIPAAMGVPGTERFLEYTFLILVGCDLATSAILLAYQRRHAPAVRTAESTERTEDVVRTIL